MHTDRSRAQAISDRLVATRRAHRRAEHQLATLLAELAEGRLYTLIGYASLDEYAETVLDLSPRQSRDLLRIGRALPRLPTLAASLEAGEIDWTKAQELLRVATLETEAAWVERARAVPSRVLEREVTYARVGEPPPAGELPLDRRPARERMVIELESVDRELFDTMLAMLAAKLGTDGKELDRGALVGAAAQMLIERLQQEEAGDAPPQTGERHRVVIDHCPSCRDDTIRTFEGVREVSETVAAEAACDAEVVDMRPGPSQGHATRTIPPTTRRKGSPHNKRQHRGRPQAAAARREEGACPRHVTDDATPRMRAGGRPNAPFGVRRALRCCTARDGGARCPIVEAGSGWTSTTSTPGRAEARMLSTTWRVYVAAIIAPSTTARCRWSGVPTGGSLSPGGTGRSIAVPPHVGRSPRRDGSRIRIGLTPRPSAGDATSRAQGPIPTPPHEDRAPSRGWRARRRTRGAPRKRHGRALASLPRAGSWSKGDVGNDEPGGRRGAALGAVRGLGAPLIRLLRGQREESARAWSPTALRAARPSEVRHEQNSGGSPTSWRLRFMPRRRR